MKNFFYFAVPTAIVVFLFLSFINLIGKTMKSGNNPNSQSQTSDVLKDQSIKIQQAKDDQERLMQDRKRQMEEQRRMLRDRQRK